MFTIALIAALGLQPSTSAVPPSKPEAPSPTPGARAPLPDPSLHVADLDGIAVRFVDAATTVPTKAAADRAIVLVHGWSCDHTVWAEQIDALTGLGRVIAIDLPGHGASDKPRIEYSMDLFARAIAAALDEAGVEKAVLIGHSNGVPVVRQFSRLYPDRTLGLVSVDGALKPWFDDPAEMEGFIAPLRGDDYMEFASAFVGSTTAPMKDRPDAERVKEIILATPQHVMVGAMEAAADPRIWIDDRISVPLLVMNAPSPWWTPEYIESIKAMGDDVTYSEIKGTSHFLMMDEPEEFNATLIRWIGERHLVGGK